jgi:hypothetical protein
LGRKHKRNPIGCFRRGSVARPTDRSLRGFVLGLPVPSVESEEAFQMVVVRDYDDDRRQQQWRLLEDARAQFGNLSM